MNDSPQRYMHILKDVGKMYMKSSVQWFRKNKRILLTLLALCIVVMVSKRKSQLVQLKGKEEQGRNYAVQYIFRKKTNYQHEIDVLLGEIEQALDINKPGSEVALFNHYNSTPFHYQTPFLYPLLAKSKEVHKKTQGAFDPTVAPLIKIWKESLQNNTRPTETDILRSKPYVGLDYIVVNEKRVKKLKEEVNINLNNLIPSYQVDAIASLLKAHGIQNFCIQLGNETLFRGSSAHKEPWKIVQKIATHQSVDNLLDVHIHLQDKAIAILQNYTTQDYTIQEHSTDRLDIIIDPLTGQLATNSFIAAFVFAEDCITARAYATAFMAKSFPVASNIVESIAGIDLFFIYKDEAEAIKFYHSPGLQIQHIESSNKVVIQKSDIKPSNTLSTDSTKEEKKS